MGLTTSINSFLKLFRISKTVTVDSKKYRIIKIQMPDPHTMSRLTVCLNEIGARRRLTEEETEFFYFSMKKILNAGISGAFDFDQFIIDSRGWGPVYELLSHILEFNMSSYAQKLREQKG